MKVLKDKRTRAVIMVMAALFAIGLLVNKIVRDYQNNSVDPRVVPARKLYEKYNTIAYANKIGAALHLMDSVEATYQKYEHYKTSYEVGVLYNNKASIYLTMALYMDSMTFDLEDRHYSLLEKDSLFRLAEINVDKSIEIYSEWMRKYSDKTEAELLEMLKVDFLQELKAEEAMKNRYLHTRIKELITAQFETPRRLSVSYTNLGIIERHRENYDEAAEKYIKALELWPDNLTAENNLNILLDKPLKKRNAIQKMFPKDRK